MTAIFPPIKLGFMQSSEAERKRLIVKPPVVRSLRARGLTIGNGADSFSAILAMPAGALSSGLTQTISTELSRHGSWGLSVFYALGSMPRAAV